MSRSIIGAFLSGLCLYLAVSHMVAFLVWIALVPMFLVLGKHSAFSPWRNRRSFLTGLVTGATFSVCAFVWVIPGAHAFTGASIGYGLAIFLLFVSVFSFGCATLLWLTPPVLIAPTWVLAEIVLQWAAEKMPWFLFHIGNALASDLYAIQPVSVIGVAGAGFVIITVNYLVALAIRRRSWKYAWAPLLLFGSYMIWAWWLLPSSDKKQGPSFTLSILTENIPPEIPWDQTNGNERVQELLRQQDQCLVGHPQMILWAESAIPWTWSPDDELVGELLRHSGPQPVTHILGMNTAVSAGVVRNSAYCLLPGGKTAGRYDKRKPLLFIEQPGLGWQLPFISSGGYSVEPGDSDLPLVTPYGKAGVLICNESVLPDVAASRVRQGAQFLLNMSNDGWYRNTWLVAQHFYNARLRAVETRKDLAVNSNNGWSGCIYASGRIDTTGLLFTIRPNEERPMAVRHPLLPAYACLFFLITITGTARWRSPH
ncbi:MAG: apolipoprotein N-acyltransferase [Chitinophagaceae bacterium]|nr:apolipoprotein N-acyltransferase [Chitinophagaceae bacterium]